MPRVIVSFKNILKRSSGSSLETIKRCPNHLSEGERRKLISRDWILKCGFMVVVFLTNQMLVQLD